MALVVKFSFIYAKLKFGCDVLAITYKAVPTRIPAQYVLTDMVQAEETAHDWSHMVYKVRNLSLLLTEVQNHEVCASMLKQFEANMHGKTSNKCELKIVNSKREKEDERCPNRSDIICRTW